MYKKDHLYNSELNTRIVFQSRIEFKELYFNVELYTVLKYNSELYTKVYSM